MRLSIFLLLFFPVCGLSQSFKFDVIESGWSEGVEESTGKILKTISNPTDFQYPHLWLTIRVDSSAFSYFQKRRSVPLKVHWKFNGFSYRSKSRNVISLYNFRNPESISLLKQEMEEKGYFTLNIWSKTMAKIKKVNLELRLQYRNKKTAQSCNGNLCLYDLKVN